MYYLQSNLLALHTDMSIFKHTIIACYTHNACHVDIFSVQVYI